MGKTKKELVAELLKKNTDGLTIVEISKELEISRNTVAVALAELKGAEMIRVRPVGKAKLNYWGGNKR
ncbi:helix-turn-helix transcriptional regulator [Candidatus Pacearchaeota archaeon]|nr:helix-turn-helix transcriptional regulator [Candidatus Pacearchaeota archaeon]